MAMGCETTSSYHHTVRFDVLGMLPDDAGRVLDFGGGAGATSAHLRSNGRATHATLLDQVAAEALPQVDLAEAIDLNDQARLDAALVLHGPFDTILALDVLEHLIDPWAAFQRLEKALEPGGTMIVSLPNASHHSVLIPLLCGRFDYGDAGVMDRTHLRWFTKATMVELCTQGELKVDCIEANIGGRRDKALATVSLGALERYVASQYRIRLTKPAS